MTQEIVEYIILGLVLVGCGVFIFKKIRRKLAAFNPSGSGCEGCCGCGTGESDKLPRPTDRTQE